MTLSATDDLVVGADGILNLTATSRVAGEHLVGVTVDGKTPSTSPARLSFVPLPIRQVQLTIDPQTVQDAGSTFEITATVTGDAGVLVHAAPVTFALPDGLTIVAPDPNPCLTTDTGTCSITVTSQATGSYPVTATASGIVSNEVVAQFKAGPVDPSTSSVRMIRDGANYNGTDRNIAEVTARDQYGNPVEGAQVTATGVAGESSGLSVQQDASPTGANGTTTIWFTSTEKGQKRADVLIDQTVTPAGSPVTMTFSDVDPPLPINSEWKITPTTSLVVGTGDASRFTLEATIRTDDQEADPVAGVVVTFTSSQGGTAWGDQPGMTQSCTTNSSGICSVTVTSTKAGTFAFTAGMTTGLIGQAQLRDLDGWSGVR